MTEPDYTTLTNGLQDADVEIIDIEGVEGWKAEVGRLLDELDYMQREVIASQMMAGLILQKVGDVLVTKQEVEAGLPGKHLDFVETDTDITFRLADD